MVDYNDVPQANTLYGESERTQQAVANMDAGATLVSFTIGGMPTSGSNIMPGVPITIVVDEPPSDALMADIRAWLVQRQDNINTQLGNLDVTNTPDPIGPPPAKK